jgi:serine protease Do
VQQGDVIITVNNRPVTPDESLAYIVSSLSVGSRVPVELIRDGQRRTVNIVIGERPPEEELARLNGVEDETPVTEPAESQQSTGQRSTRQSLGLTVQTLTPEMARSLRLTDTRVAGVVVSGVDPSSDAAAEGVQSGDIILSINQRATRTPEEAAAAVESARRAGRDSVLLLVRRGNAPPVYVGVGLKKR